MPPEHNETDDTTVEAEDSSVSDDGELSRAERKSTRQKKDLDACLLEKQEYLDGWQRARADLINIQKQIALERVQLVELGKERLAEDLIPVLDSFDIAFANKNAWAEVSEGWRKGVEYIYQQCLQVLTENGITPFDPRGEPFDPQEHESIALVPLENHKPNTVALVHQKGYRTKNRILRPAKVSVAHEDA